MDKATPRKLGLEQTGLTGNTGSHCFPANTSSLSSRLAFELFFLPYLSTTLIYSLASSPPILHSTARWDDLFKIQKRPSYVSLKMYNSFLLPLE